MSLSLHQMTVLSSVLIRVSIAVVKYHDHKQLWEERVYFSLQLTSQVICHLLAEVRAGTWREELTKRLPSGDAYWLATHG